MKELKILLGATARIFFLIILPRMRIESIPPEFMAPFGSAQVVINFLTVIGLITTTLYVVKNLTPKTNPINLGSSIGMALAKFYSFLFFIGFGEPGSFGIVEKTIPGEVTAVLISDLRIFVQLLVVVLVIEIAAKVLEFYNTTSAVAARQE